MTEYKVNKDPKNEILFSVKVESINFTALDVFYTISQNYSDVLVSDTVYLSPEYPDKVLPLDLCPGDNDVASAMVKSGVDMYFDPDGIFMFSNKLEPDPDRAAKEFMGLYEQNKVIMAPSMTKYIAEADTVTIKSGIGSEVILYFYRRLV